MEQMPLLFVGHGSPMNAILDNEFTRSLAKVVTDIPKPKAILVISAHWLSRGTLVTCNDRPRQIYDFYGFPEELNKVVYQPKGGIELARNINQRTGRLKIRCATDWGLDHGSWAILKHMYPNADIPVMELSLDYNQPVPYHYYFAPLISFLRNEGFLIIGSGNIVHNLKVAAYDNLNAAPFEWAEQFDETVKTLIVKEQHNKLFDYEKQLPNALMAHPSNEHYLPLLYILALQKPGEPVNFFYEGIQNASVSMRSFKIG